MPRASVRAPTSWGKNLAPASSPAEPVFDHVIIGLENARAPFELGEGALTRAASPLVHTWARVRWPLGALMGPAKRACLASTSLPQIASRLSSHDMRPFEVRGASRGTRGATS